MLNNLPRRGLSANTRKALLTMTAVLLSFGCALAIEHGAHLSSAVPVLAVVMTLNLSRTTAEPGAIDLVRRIVVLPIVAYGATQVGQLMLHHVALGDTLFVLGLSFAIWLRRFGRIAARIGGLIALPFIGILIVPVPVSVATANSIWMPVIALMALAWVTVVTLLARRIGWAPDGPDHATVATSTAVSRDGAGPTARGPVPPSTKMAVQLAVALGLAFLVGHWLYPHHWPWLVLSCYLVCSGNRGRGDVVHKGVLRLIGAGVGTASATLLAGAFAAGDRIAIVLIFVVLAAAVWLRQRSYAFWAAGVTAMLALLNGYYGVSGPHELVQRLGGVFLGALIGVAVSWFVLPVRSGAVFRRRSANCLAALSDYLAALRADPGAAAAGAESFAGSVAQLEQLLPTFRFHQRTVARLGGNADAHAAQVIVALADLRSPLEALRSAMPPDGFDRATATVLGGLAKQVGTIRRRMRPTAWATEPAPPLVFEVPSSGYCTDVALSDAIALLDRLDTAFTVDLWQRHGGRPSGAPDNPAALD